MIEKEIKITADVSEADKDINGLLEKIERNSREAKDGVESLEKEVKGVGDTAKSGVKGVNGLRNSFKGLGLAMKALGIGLVIQGIQIVGELFSRNQKVVDFFGTAFETLSIAFNDFFNFIISNAGTVTGFFKDIFENPSKYAVQLGEAIKANLIERFVSLIEVAGFLGDAMRKLFQGDFQGAFDSAKEAGLEMADVLTGVDDVVNKVGDGISDLVDTVSNYASETYNAAKANIQLKNSAQLAAAEQGRLVEQYDRLAEIQRQIRDDESISISERQEANERLGKILQDQEKAMIAQANLQVAAAQALVNTNASIENRVALTEALANKEGVLAQVEGFRSEQLVNRIALLKEENELNQTVSDAELARQIAQLEFEATQEQDALLKLEREKERLELENEGILEDLEYKKELYALGTQARVDAEQDYLNRKQEIDNAITDNERQAAAEREKIATDSADAKEYTEEQLHDATVSLAGQTLDLVGALAEEGSELAKGVAVAQAIMNTYSSAVSSYNSMSGIPVVGPALGAVAAGLAVASGLVNVQKILDTKPIETSAPSGGGGSAPAPPSFNLVEGTESNQIADSINTGTEPVRAVVVSGDVTTAQQVDRNIIEGSSI